LIEDYFRQVDTLVSRTDVVHSTRITFDKRSEFIGFIRGEVYFLDGSSLHLREFVDVEHGVSCYQYAYHYQRTDGALVFRYDDTPHFAGLSTFPHHKHEGSEDNVVAAPAADLAHVLTEIQRLIVASAQRPSTVPSS